MRHFAVVNETRGVNLATSAELADRFWTRLRGLLGRDHLPAGQGLWIDRCNAIHTFLMRFPIDAVFLDRQFRVVGMVHDLGAGRMTRMHWRAVSCLELPAGAVAPTGTGPGDQLSFRLIGPTRP